MADVSFFDPQKEAEVKRRRLFAEQLMKQGQQTPNEMVSGIVVQKSPIEGLAKALQTGLAGYQAGQADKLQTEDTAQRQKVLADAISQYGQDPQAAAQMLMQSPSTSDMGMKMYMDAVNATKQEKQWQKEAELRLKIAGMRTGQTIESDPETGELIIVDNTPSEANTEGQKSLAESLGVPFSPLQKIAGMSEKDFSKYAQNTAQKANERLNDPDFVGALSKATSQGNQLKNFENLMKEQPTGGWRALPIIGAAAAKFDPEMRTMKSIQDKLTPSQREPGSGATSNFDAEMFANALPSYDKPKETNQIILSAMNADLQNTKDYQAFLSDYNTANGNLNGADKAWQSYVEANPIFSPDSTASQPKLNPNRMSYQEFFGGGITERPIQPVTPQNDVRARLEASGVPPERIDAYLRAKGL